jgi:hypothetical protein
MWAVYSFLYERVEAGLIWRLVRLKDNQLATTGDYSRFAFKRSIRKFAECALCFAKTACVHAV